MYRMNNKNLLIIVALLLVATAAAFFLFMKDQPVTSDIETQIQYAADGQPIVYCDESGNRYTTTAEAKAAGLTEAQYGATYCPEYVAAQTGDYQGLSVNKAEEIAQTRGELFRVVEVDGVAQPIPEIFKKVALMR